jgi:hypothetical protein
LLREILEIISDEDTLGIVHVLVSGDRGVWKTEKRRDV